jgi:hypothetical protein
MYKSLMWNIFPKWQNSAQSGVNVILLEKLALKTHDTGIRQTQLIKTMVVKNKANFFRITGVHSLDPRSHWLVEEEDEMRQHH